MMGSPAIGVGGECDWRGTSENGSGGMTHRIPAARRGLRLAQDLLVKFEFLRRSHFVARGADSCRGSGLVRGHCVITGLLGMLGSGPWGAWGCKPERKRLVRYRKVPR